MKAWKKVVEIPKYNTVDGKKPNIKEELNLINKFTINLIIIIITLATYLYLFFQSSGVYLISCFLTLYPKIV